MIKNNIVTLIGVAIASIVFFGCEKDDNCTRGVGSMTSRELILSSFTEIDLEGSSNVEISYGESQKVMAYGQSNIIDKVSLVVKDQKWDVYLQSGCFSDYDLWFELILPKLTKVVLSGSGHLLINDFINQGDLELSNSGSGDINLNKFSGCENLVAQISSSGSVILNKSWDGLNDQVIDISGSGNYRAYDVSTKRCTVRISSSGLCEVSVEEELSVNISGSGSVYYRGVPSVSASISGSGVVQQVD